MLKGWRYFTTMFGDYSMQHSSTKFETMTSDDGPGEDATLLNESEISHHYNQRDTKRFSKLNELLDKDDISAAQDAHQHFNSISSLENSKLSSLPSTLQSNPHCGCSIQLSQPNIKSETTRFCNCNRNAPSQPLNYNTPTPTPIPTPNGKYNLGEQVTETYHKSKIYEEPNRTNFEDRQGHGISHGLSNKSEIHQVLKRSNYEDRNSIYDVSVLEDDDGEIDERMTDYDVDEFLEVRKPLCPLSSGSGGVNFGIHSLSWPRHHGFIIRTPAICKSQSSAQKNLIAFDP